MAIDYTYMAETLSTLSGIPVRLYRGECFQELFYPNRFKPDLAVMEEKNIFAKGGNVSYYTTDTFLSFGLFRVNRENVSFILGPVAQTDINRPKVREILRAIGEPMSRDAELLNYLRAIPTYPLSTFLQILCAFNYFINGERLSAGELIADAEQGAIPELPATEYYHEATPYIHNTYDLEQQLLGDVENGRTDSIRAMFQHPLPGRPGVLASEDLRQQKNLLICTATLISRAAIRGGMTVEDAFTLSDLYIQKAELLTRPQAITQLQAEMVMEYTRRVESIHGSGAVGRLSRSVRSFVLQNISRPVTTEELAAHLNMSRPYLCKNFRAETGESIGRFITNLRIDEAKRLLTVSQKPLGEIADALGFSSQSYFQNVFKSKTGMTPLEYRNYSK